MYIYIYTCKHVHTCIHIYRNKKRRHTYSYYITFTFHYITLEYIPLNTIKHH